MAVDEAILEAVGKNQVLPTLRLYSWEPPCLSIGYAQPASDASLKELNKQGWDFVRRPTGGRAILHADELTYSIIGYPTDPRLAGGIPESYRILSQAFLHALHKLGIPAESDDYKASGIKQVNYQLEETRNPVCFEVPSDYEITVYGKKLIGSAQARRKDGILQHGSLPLQGDLLRIVEVLNFSTPEDRVAARQRLSNRAVTVEQVLGKMLPFGEIAKALTESFQQVLSLDLLLSEINEAEFRRAQELVKDKYSHPGWTFRV